jgi:ketosteroid isomerase-like protein
MKFNMIRGACAATAIMCVATLTPRATQAQAKASAADSATVAQVVAQFHSALVAGDSAGVMALLADDAQILESGGIETRADYRAHHLEADIAYAKAVSSTPGPLKISVNGNTAWVSSTSASKGTYRERPVNSVTAELMVLVRTSAGWRISAIHWSSRQVRS